MCGINGILLKEPANGLTAFIAAMNSEIIHRGPDDHGVYIDGERLAMGMRRLSVIDLAGGHQPMLSESGDLVIVFNGEIYNYRSLRAELEAQGVIFRSHSDTEVILYLYGKQGVACLQSLDGMFAFSLYDKQKGTVFIARDRFGEKPLYYHASAGKFIWASELKSIAAVFPDLKVINPEALELYFSLTYIPAPYTIYKDVVKLEPGHYLEVLVEGLAVSVNRYWDIEADNRIDPAIDFEAAKKELRQLVIESVEKRLIADVPVGVFLSGGVDSAIVAAVAARVGSGTVNTFTVGFHDKLYDESERAAMVAKHVGAKHETFIMDHDHVLESLNTILLNYDEPFADSSAIPAWFVSQMARSSVTVALTGDGADEVFAGYNKYRAAALSAKFGRIPAPLRSLLTSDLITQKVLGGRPGKSAYTRLSRLLRSLRSDPLASHFRLMALGFKDEELGSLLCSHDGRTLRERLEPLLPDAVTGMSLLKRLRYIDKNISLEGDMLVKVDRATMLSSLECRAPFLDHRIMEFTCRIPDDYLLYGKKKKRILKDTFADLLPAGFMNAPKLGFEVPVGAWLRGGLRQELLDLTSASALEHRLLNNETITLLVNEHLSGFRDHSWKLWSVFCFQKWYLQAFMKNTL
jgi:asparagine synthase (glutamine-hydrolysing)